MTIAEFNNQVRRYRDDAKAAHDYTNAELAKKVYTSESALSHKDTLYRLPYHVVMRMKELATYGK